jgi:glycosyltransferase involved in cell wall biosynthesis
MFEAASCGKALISTNVGAISECIKPKINGYLINIEYTEKSINNVIDQFEEYIIYLSMHRDTCKLMGKNSRSIILSNWTWEKRVQNWKKLFDC